MIKSLDIWLKQNGIKAKITYGYDKEPIYKFTYKDVIWKFEKTSSHYGGGVELNTSDLKGGKFIKDGSVYFSGHIRQKEIAETIYRYVSEINEFKEVK